MIEAVIESKQHFDTLVDINEKHFLDFWYPDSLARIKLNDSFQEGAERGFSRRWFGLRRVGTIFDQRDKRGVSASHSTCHQRRQT